MRTHNTPRLCAGPQTAGTPIKFWNVASTGDDEGEITLYGDVVSRQPVDWWTGEPEPLPDADRSGKSALPDPQAGHSYRRGAAALARRPGRSPA